ncbi:hypothetical protein GCM10009117_15180 [Gangjinia marincola]|uniref:Uncharacterized protein n=1 Tax=Gangjinia marincola TaxID=578463 RepID=A0ABN1MGX4_9FLAO
MKKLLCLLLFPLLSFAQMEKERVKTEIPSIITDIDRKIDQERSVAKRCFDIQNEIQQHSDYIKVVSGRNDVDQDMIDFKVDKLTKEIKRLKREYTKLYNQHRIDPYYVKMYGLKESVSTAQIVAN